MIDMKSNQSKEFSNVENPLALSRFEKWFYGISFGFVIAGIAFQALRFFGIINIYF